MEEKLTLELQLTGLYGSVARIHLLYFLLGKKKSSITHHHIQPSLSVISPTTFGKYA